MEELGIRTVIILFCFAIGFGIGKLIQYVTALP